MTMSFPLESPFREKKVFCSIVSTSGAFSQNLVSKGCCFQTSLVLRPQGPNAVMYGIILNKR